MTGSTMPLAQTLDSPDWTLLRNLGLALVVVLWLATAYWTFKDARRRIEDPWLVALATLIGLFPPFLGPIIYLFFRPPEYLQDVRERDLEIKAMEERLVAARPALPGVPGARRAVVHRLPGLHDAARAGMPVVRPAARVAVAGVPVLRDGDHARAPGARRRDVAAAPRRAE